MNAWLEALPPWGVALPWLVVPAVLLVRAYGSRSITEYEPLRGADVPRVTVVIPARDEARNIERCLRSLLATTYANAEFIVVDDHSSDGTGALAARAIAHDARARVTTPPPLPDGWFGKQWACAHAATLATGDLLLFTDADTWHAPDLIGRAAGALEARGADLLSVVGELETRSFWEHVVQPAMSTGFFALMGSTERMSRAQRPRRKLASGQFLLVRRADYDALDGHRAVGAFVAEDVMLAQTWTAAGRTVHVITGVAHLKTRMYRSLSEIVHGWGKNVWAGGRHFLPPHPVWLAIARVVVPLVPWLSVVPILALTLGALGVLPHWWLVFGGVAYVFQSAALMALYAHMGARVGYALLEPLGAVIIAWIFTRAAVRGSRTEWKGRTYRAA